MQSSDFKVLINNIIYVVCWLSCAKIGNNKMLEEKVNWLRKQWKTGFWECINSFGFVATTKWYDNFIIKNRSRKNSSLFIFIVSTMCNFLLFVEGRVWQNLKWVEWTDSSIIKLFVDKSWTAAWKLNSKELLKQSLICLCLKVWKEIDLFGCLRNVMYNTYPSNK